MLKTYWKPLKKDDPGAKFFQNYCDKINMVQNSKGAFLFCVFFLNFTNKKKAKQNLSLVCLIFSHNDLEGKGTPCTPTESTRVII